MLMYEYPQLSTMTKYSLYYFPELNLILVDKNNSEKFPYRIKVKKGDSIQLDHSGLDCDCMGATYHHHCQHVSNTIEAFMYNLWEEKEPYEGFEDMIFMREEGIIER